MIDLRRLRDAPAETKGALVRRDPSLSAALDVLLEIDERRRGLLKQADTLKAERVLDEWRAA